MGPLANGTELLRWSNQTAPSRHLLLVTECLHDSAPAASAATDEENGRHARDSWPAGHGSSGPRGQLPRAIH